MIWAENLLTPMIKVLNFLQTFKKKIWLFPRMSKMVSAVAQYLATLNWCLLLDSQGLTAEWECAVTWWHSRESPQPAGADSSGGDHGCSVGCGQGEILAHGLWDGDLMSSSSTPVWDAKDALIIELVENFPVECFSVGKCWFYRFETFHRNMLIPLKVSMESRQAGCPGSLRSWLHASLGFPGSLLPRQLLLQLPDTPIRPLPQQWGGWGQGNIKWGALIPSQSLLSTEEKVCYL